MKKASILASLVVAGIFLAVFSTAALAKSNEGRPRSFFLPSRAKAVAPGIYYLGKAKDTNGHEVEGFAFIHRREAGARLTRPPKGGPSCYDYLANGAKWKTLENYLVDPDNSRGLTASFIRDNLAFDIGKWEDAADGIIDGRISKNIIGTEISGVVDGADVTNPDNKNEVLFADVADLNVIAVTIVWGYFNSPPPTRALIEWDQVYDDVDYDWSSLGEVGKMDFENIATHELGHAMGLNDVYQTACAAVTMYGYADYGETQKRSLEQPDINGIKSLYK